MFQLRPIASTDKIKNEQSLKDCSFFILFFEARIRTGRSECRKKTRQTSVDECDHRSIQLCRVQGVFSRKRRGNPSTPTYKRIKEYSSKNAPLFFYFLSQDSNGQKLSKLSFSPPRLAKTIARRREAGRMTTQRAPMDATT